MRNLGVVSMVLVLGQLASVAAQHELRAAGVVAETTAEFSIPIVPPRDGVWVWNQAATADNLLEYCWDIRVTTASGEHSFGFYRFKPPASTEARGSLEDLLKVGQASAWKPDVGGRGNSVMQGVRPSVSATSGTMLVRLTDAGLVRLLFADRPATVSVRAKTPEADSVYKTPISYRE